MYHNLLDFANPVSNENLIYLSSRQALADISHFISVMNDDMIAADDTGTLKNSNIKWITFGRSYPGMLAGLARLQYPHLVYASVSNSSPVQAQLDFPEYYDHVSFALSYEVVGGSEECLNIISGGHAQVAEIFNKYDAGERNDDDLTKVADLFNVCSGVDGLKNKMNRNVFLGDGLISLDVQGNDPSCNDKLCNIEKVRGFNCYFSLW